MKQDEVIIYGALALLAVGYFVSFKIAGKKSPINTTKRATVPPLVNTRGSPALAIADTNNNPLNIRYNPANNWQGQTGQNKGFCVFQSQAYGYRAAFVLLNNYTVKGFDTIRKIISRWAPMSENPTEKYINFVADKVGLWADTKVTKNDLPKIAEAMAIFEGGKVDQNALMEGYKMAFNKN